MTRIGATTREGLRRAWAVKRLALPLWLGNLLLALGVAVPFAVTLGGALGELPLADAAAGELRFDILFDFLEARPGFLTPFLLAALCATVLALVASAAIGGGTLEVLLGEDDRPLLHRFGRGAGRFFGRFLRLGALAGLVAALALGLGVAVVTLAAGAPADSAWEPAPAVTRFAALALGWLLALPVLLAFDAARIAVVREDGRKMRRTLWAALRRQVLRHPLRWLGQWAVFAVFVAVALGVFAGFRAVLPASGSLALLAVFLGQQVLILTKAWLRIARFGAQAALLERSTPSVSPPAGAVSRAAGPSPCESAAPWGQ